MKLTMSYKKLWKLLIDKDMKKRDRMEKTGISNFTISKRNRRANAQADILLRICEVFDCSIGDIGDADPINTREEKSERTTHNRADYPA